MGPRWLSSFTVFPFRIRCFFVHIVFPIAAITPPGVASDSCLSTPQSAIDSPDFVYYRMAFDTHKLQVRVWFVSKPSVILMVEVQDRSLTSAVFTLPTSVLD